VTFTVIRRAAQQIARAATKVATESTTDDEAVVHWVRLVVAQVAEVAAALGVSMLHHPHHLGRRSAEEYGRRLDEAIEAGGIFGCVQIAGERIARALDEVAGGTGGTRLCCASCGRSSRRLRSMDGVTIFPYRFAE
jgi:hypothetical protein